MNRLTPKFRLQLLLALVLLTALAGGPAAIAQSVVATVPASPPLWLIVVLLVIAAGAIYWFVVQHKSVADLREALHHNTQATAAATTNALSAAVPAAPVQANVMGMTKAELDAYVAAAVANERARSAQVGEVPVAMASRPASEAAPKFVWQQPQQAAPAPTAAPAPAPAPAQPAAASAAPAPAPTAPQWTPPAPAAAPAAPAAVLPPLNGTALFDMLVMVVTGQHNQGLEDKIGGREVMNAYKRDYGPGGRYADPELSMMAARAAGAITPPVFAWQGYFDRGQARPMTRSDGTPVFVWDASMLGPFADRYRPAV